MKNLDILTLQLRAAGIPAVGVDSDGRISYQPPPTAAQADAAAAMVGSFKDSDYDYLGARRAAYPPVGDQLDCITKALAFLQGKGVDVGPDGLAQVNAIAAVKAQIPKPPGAALPAQ